MFTRILLTVLVAGEVALAQVPATTPAQDGAGLLRVGRPQDAIVVLERAIHDGSDVPEVWYFLVRAYRITRQTRFASDAAEQLLRRYPDSAYTHKLMGEAYDAQFEEQNAEREFRKALSITPDMPELHFALGMILWFRHDDEAATAEFLKETTISPAFPRSWVYLAEIALGNDHPKTALEYLKTALNLDPNQYDALCQIAKCYQMLHRDEEAIDALQAAVRLKPEGQTAHYRLSRLLRKAGRIEEANREQALMLQNTESVKFRSSVR